MRDLGNEVDIFFDDGVTTTPKRRILWFVFTVLCFTKSLLIKTDC